MLSFCSRRLVRLAIQPAVVPADARTAGGEPGPMTTGR
jgi:hypothetical protein